MNLLKNPARNLPKRNLRVKRNLPIRRSQRRKRKEKEEERKAKEDEEKKAVVEEIESTGKKEESGKAKHSCGDRKAKHSCCGGNERGIGTKVQRRKTVGTKVQGRETIPATIPAMMTPQTTARVEGKGKTMGKALRIAIREDGALIKRTTADCPLLDPKVQIVILEGGGANKKRSLYVYSSCPLHTEETHQTVQSPHHQKRTGAGEVIRTG